MKKVLSAVFAALSLSAATRLAAEDSGPLPVYDGGVTSETMLTATVSTLPEAALNLSQRFTFPFLRGEHPLTAGNNISAQAAVEFTPVYVNGIADIVWTPAAFFQLSGGGRIGSGWNAEMFGSELHGIGINHRNDDGTTSVKGGAFDGVLWQVKGGATLQFDLAALFPGDWNHVVFRTYQEMNYAAYSAADDGESWFYANDYGENKNGSNYYASYLLGYQMPQKPFYLDTIGVMGEMTRRVSSAVAGGEKWGEDLNYWILSLLLNFSWTDRINTAVITQLRTVPNYTEETEDNDFYQDRRVRTGNPQLIDFYRVAAIVGIRLR